MSKKLMSVSLVLILLVGTLFLATNTSNAWWIFGDNEKKPEQQEVTIWAWNVAAKGLEATIDDFHKDYPNVKVNVVNVGRKDAYDKLTVGLASGAGLPDIVQIESQRLPTYTYKFPNGFVDLTKFGADKYIDKFDSSKWAQCKTNGKIMALPWDSAPAGVFYRTDLFKKADVNPKKIDTWNEFIAAGVKIKQSTGVKMAPYDFYDDGFFRMLMNQLGTFYFNQAGKITINSDKAVKAMKVLEKMVDKNIALKVNGWNGYITATKNKRVATIPFGVWYAGTIKDQVPKSKGKWGVMKLPAFEKGGNRAAQLGGSNLAITSQSENKKMAWAFIKNALAETKNQITMYKKYGLFPSYLPAYNHPYFDQKSEFFNNQNISKLFASTVPNIKKAYFTSGFSEALQFVVNAQAAVVTGEKTSREALNDAAKRISNALGREIKEIKE
ncbi:ABC-type sugar transport system, periplasmic component [Halobacteroides halobius DSM 5150]|uniref:ABC-type sugar transport system, periplasmic component n=1 Tax=Halobacteroides halobius (strain ATCC 35273 / DSM 5150 / MD-1) TaxID=748449 RepID=L0K9Q8_HALHC|nr:sugar ABC transporter substrate-binding protein [Halobacteroides halobius]AGB41270.1 ABC-type sugar transport system, periplasmic component [Halobacteroides halobius DSM 5150]